MIRTGGQFALLSHGPARKDHSREEVTWCSETEHWTGSQDFVCRMAKDWYFIFLSLANETDSTGLEQ